MAGARVAVITIALLLLLLISYSYRRVSIIAASSQKRTAALARSLKAARVELSLARKAAAREKLRLQRTIGLNKAENSQSSRLRALLRVLEERRRIVYEERRRAALMFDSSPDAAGNNNYWHAVQGDGDCPGEIPQWDWQLLLKAAEAARIADGVERESALEALSAQSQIATGQLTDLVHRYASVLANPEFDGILDAQHPECNNTARFASLEGDRVLRMSCDDPKGARYALDDDATLHRYLGPVRIPDAESILAFCGDEFNLLSHPKHHPDVLERAKSSAGSSFGTRKPSVLVFMVDATSRAHFRRSMPRTLRALELIAKHGANAAKVAARGGDGDSSSSSSSSSSDDGEASSSRGRIHVFDFLRYNVVGYNSMPNQIPLFCGTSPEELSGLSGERCVWEMFKRGGGVTMMAEEIHDACESQTTTINAVYRGAYSVQSSELPDHQWWKLFCSPHIRPCCWHKSGFLNPGRRQCVGGGRTLHEVMIGYLEEFWTAYLDAPRRFAAINTMVAHEHFMLRLPSLDADLAALLLRMAPTVLQDTVVLLLSDHGSHGIWYTDFEIGATEHQLPFLYVLAPDWLLAERPGWLAALTVNQRRLVTVHELYRTMRILAAWPDKPASADGAPSLFDALPEGRTCKEAGIPEVYCACRHG